MDWNVITQLISSIGFPILACVYMFKYMNKQSETHKEEIDKLSTAVNNNTIIITKLYERLGGNSDEEHTNTKSN